MDIQDMRIFARVAAVQNLSAVGTELGLTPGTISKRIQALEDELSARLFDRTTRSIRITEEGATFLGHVERILSEIEAARASVDDKVSKPKGKLKIAAPACLGRRYVAPALCEFVRAFPEIDVQVDLHDRQVNLQEDGYDVAIRTGALSDSSLIAKRLAPDRHVIAASPAYLARAGRPLRAGGPVPATMPGAGRAPAVVVQQERRREHGAGRAARSGPTTASCSAAPPWTALGLIRASELEVLLRAALGQARAGAGRLRGRHQCRAVGALSERQAPAAAHARAAGFSRRLVPRRTRQADQRKHAQNANAAGYCRQGSRTRELKVIPPSQECAGMMVSLQPDADAIGASAGIDHGELEEAAAAGRQFDVAALGVGRDRLAVDEPGERQDATLGLDDDAGALAVLDLEFGTVGREGNLHGGLEIAASRAVVRCTFAEALERRRQVALATLRAPDGAACIGVRRAAMRANASNSSGAAVVRPVSPGVEAPSGRPTHTATMWRPS